MKNFKWEGVMPAITTQFDVHGNLDLAAFKNNLTHQIQAGVHGIILGGTLGEASTLTSEEKQQLLTTTLDEVILLKFDFVEGDPFNKRKITEAADKIRSLGFFSDVNIFINNNIF